MRFLKRRPFMSVAFGAVLAVAFLVLVRPGLLRDARAQGAHMLNYTAALVNAAQGDAAAVQKQGCRYDTTPEVVADGDVHAVRCDAEGDQFVNVNTIPLTEVQGDQVTPAAQTTVACDDTGAVAFTANAASVRLEIWNAGVNDVCLRWGTAGTPDRTPTACRRPTWASCATASA